MVVNSVGESGNRFFITLVVFTKQLSLGNVPEHIKDIFYVAKLCALNKDGGGIRPIAGGNALRRLATKVGKTSIDNGL